MVLHSTRELDEGMSGKVISGIGGSFRRNTHGNSSTDIKGHIRILIRDLFIIVIPLLWISYPYLRPMLGY